MWKRTSASFSHPSDKHWGWQQWSLPGMKTAPELSTWCTRHTQCTNAILWSDMPALPGQLIMWFIVEARLEMCGKHVHIHPHTLMHPMDTISHTCKHRNTCTHVWTMCLLVRITVQIHIMCTATYHKPHVTHCTHHCHFAQRASSEAAWIEGWGAVVICCYHGNGHAK